ncbi:MAG TPA: pyridoxine 5'-phosphate oxidase C-terminal domain-containing protein, partial [Casimicrobiaceae bacterium]|nr:pyridoxine 5'-phosphate oxidase C-terminal domain-containing protein [Casimicrobiaceae bacterium]
RERPRESQLSAWASPQSEAIPDRAFLDARLEAVRARFQGEVPRPPNWGGIRAIPNLFEFWQGRASRTHDRLRYTRRASGWTIERLAP